MIRDMCLIREILLAVDAWGSPGGDGTFAALGRSKQEIEYNVYQARVAGLVEGSPSMSPGSLFACSVTGLTPAGHDFLEAARDCVIWGELIGRLKSKGMVSPSVQFVKRLLDAAACRSLEAREAWSRPQFVSSNGYSTP